jgi:hypothetical protein
MRTAVDAAAQAAQLARDPSRAQANRHFSRQPVERARAVRAKPQAAEEAAEIQAQVNLGQPEPVGLPWLSLTQHQKRFPWQSNGGVKPTLGSLQLFLSQLRS